MDRARTYPQVRGRFSDARPLQERALAIDKAAYRPDHPTVATDLNNLAQILRDLGQPEAAQSLRERAQVIPREGLSRPIERQGRPEADSL